MRWGEGGFQIYEKFERYIVRPYFFGKFRTDSLVLDSVIA